MLRAFVASLDRLPAFTRPYIARITDQVTYLLLWRFRKRMRDTLERTMGKELPTDAERRTVVRAAWRNLTYALIESSAVFQMTRDELCSRIEIKGEERLRTALARKKGVIALSAHFGNFLMISPPPRAPGL